MMITEFLKNTENQKKVTNEGNQVKLEQCVTMYFPFVYYLEFKYFHVFPCEPQQAYDRGDKGIISPIL